MNLTEITDIKCPFCKELALGIKAQNIMIKEKTHKEYTVALIEEMWLDKMGKEHTATTIHYYNKNKGYSLKYCPCCGTKIDLRKFK